MPYHVYYIDCPFTEAKLQDTLNQHVTNNPSYTLCQLLLVPPENPTQLFIVFAKN